jgi:hypothetical protein
MPAKAKKTTSNSAKKSSNPSDFSKGVKATVANVKSKANENLETCQQHVRESPRKAILIALGAGYCLHRLPVCTLIAAPLRLTALLAKPALLVLGAAKLYDMVEEQSRK